MKKDLHPTYYDNCIITCACGNAITVGSTRESIFVELCNRCHPFYTGKQKLVDTAGRVERFQKRASKKNTVALEKKRVKKVTRRALKQKDNEK